MFQNIDKDRLEQMMDSHPEYRRIIDQLLENHRLSLSSISHEIRNPLTLIYSSLQLIQVQHPEVLTYAHWVQTIGDVEYMIELLNEISSYNNGDALHFATFSLKDTLQNMILSFAMSLEDSGIEVTGNVDPRINDMIGDKVKIQEVLLNLFTNAKQAILDQDESIRKEKPGKISIQAERSHGKTILRVSDNGCGIEKDRMQSIYTPFVTSKQEGTGLGLAISKKIAEAHQGLLTCESEPGKGTTFELIL